MILRLFLLTGFAIFTALGIYQVVHSRWLWATGDFVLVVIMVWSYTESVIDALERLRSRESPKELKIEHDI